MEEMNEEKEMEEGEERLKNGKEGGRENTGLVISYYINWHTLSCILQMYDGRSLEKRILLRLFWTIREGNAGLVKQQNKLK